jgi:hypothetical protein
MKRFLSWLNWAALFVAVVAATLFAVALVADDVHVIESYGFGSGPGAHTGYGALAEGLFLGLPAAGGYVLALVTAIVWRVRYDASFLRRLARTTVGLLVLGGAVGVFELSIEHLNAKERERTANESARIDALTANHDELGAYARSHDVNAPLPGSGITPLHAAVAHRFVDLVRELVGKGATVSDDDLTVASQSDDVEILTLLLDHESGLSGNAALDVTYSAGSDDAVRLLVAHGAQATQELLSLLNGQSFKLFPGEVRWAELASRWKTDPATPGVIANRIAYHPEKPFPANESDVLVVLAETLGSTDLCIDKGVAIESLPIEPWRKKRALCTCNYCPYARAINWAILVALYPEWIPPLSKSKSVAMFRVIARGAASSHDDPRPVVRTAVGDLNVDVLKILEEEGFDLHAVDGELDENAFSLNTDDGAAMKAHLIAAGVRWRSP